MFAVAPTFATVSIPVYTATKNGINISQMWRSPFKVRLTEVGSIRCRYRAQITVIMCEQKSYPIPYGFRVGGSIPYSMNIRHLHISHNAPYLPRKILHKHCFQFPLGRLRPRRNEKQSLCNFFLLGGRGAAQIRCIMGDVQVAYSLNLKYLVTWMGNKQGTKENLLKFL